MCRTLVLFAVVAGLLACVDDGRIALRESAEAQCAANPAPPPEGFTCDGGCCPPEPADAGESPACDGGAPGASCLPCGTVMIDLTECRTFPTYCPDGRQACPPGFWALDPALLGDDDVVTCVERRGQVITKRYCVE